MVEVFEEEHDLATKYVEDKLEFSVYCNNHKVIRFVFSILIYIHSVWLPIHVHYMLPE